MEDVFTTFDIVKRLKIKRERLKDWQTRGYIKPSIQKARGRGTKNLFSRWDVYMIKLFEHMVSRGFSRAQAAKRIKSINAEYKKDPVRVEGTWNFIMIGESARKEDYPWRAISKAGLSFSVSIGNTVTGFRDSENMFIPGGLENLIQIHLINFGYIKDGVDDDLGFSDKEIKERKTQLSHQVAEMDKKDAQSFEKLIKEIKEKRLSSREGGEDS